jgi:hypothetical protein
MKKRFYFRRPSQFAFNMDVTINDDKHEENFLASMVRKGYEIVPFDTYIAELSKFKNTRLSYGGRKY